MIGRTLAHYEITELLGKGGMGEVYRARDGKLKRDVALKILPPEVADDPARLKRFQREAELVASLNHPQIVTIYSVESDGPTHFLTMELVEGTTLQSTIRPGGMPLDEFLELAIPLADGLHAAHERNVIHRDLKPSNIMLGRSGTPKILDFGLAKLRQADPGTAADQLPSVTDLTLQGQTMGTVDYMSPEQIRGHKLDAHSDLFSLGVVFYELLSGQHAFRRASAPETQSAVLGDPAPELHTLNPRLPTSISRVVRRCLEKDPRQRMQSALELRNELKDLQRERIAGAAPSSEQNLRGRETRRGAVSAWWLLGPLVILLAALALWKSGIFSPSAQPGAAVVDSQRVIRVAILPFSNQGSPDDAFFVEGMREEIATRLGAIRGLGIVSQTTASGLHVEDRSFQEIGAELASEYVVTASVFTDRSDEDAQKVRVTPRVVRVRDNLQLWSGSFSAELLPGEIFEIQAQIAERVAKSVDVELVDRDASALRAKPTLDAAAYDDYLLGRYYWNRRTAESLRRAAQFFQRAIERDSEFVRAYAGLADCLALYPFYGITDLEDPFGDAQRMAERAVELDPQLGEAFASLAFAKMYGDWDWAGADADFRKAIELSPDYAVAHYWYTELLISLGDYERGLEHARIAVDLEPALPIARHIYSVALTSVDRFPEAITEANRAVELEPAFLLPHFVLGLGRLVDGDIDGWGREFRHFDLPPEIPELITALQRGDISDAEAREQALRLASEATPAMPTIQKAVLHILIRDLDGAMQLLEEAVAERDLAVILVPAWVDRVPLYAALGDHPGYEGLLESLGFEERLVRQRAGSR